MSGRLGPYAINTPELGKRVTRLIVGRRAFMAHKVRSLKTGRTVGGIEKEFKNIL
jgi:hypothetical protein